METVKIIRLKNLSRTSKKLIYDGQKECARLWNLCCTTHLNARKNGEKWPIKEDLRKSSKGGKYNIHSQTIQMVIATFLANVDTALQVKKINKKMRLPYREKIFYALMWPKQAVKIRDNRIYLPMGRGTKSLVLKYNEKDLASACCKIIWNDGFELHICQNKEVEEKIISSRKAAIDLGQIHLAGVAIDDESGFVFSGRGIRSEKRLINKSIRKASKKTQNCIKASKRSKKIHKAKRKVIRRAKRRIRDLRHKTTTGIVKILKEKNVEKVFVGNPEGVRKKNSGKKQNQRLAGWEYGKDFEYLKYKSKLAGIECFNGPEYGTSSHCPQCSHKQKPKGRRWKCKKCGFASHRDIVGPVNMFPLAFDQKVNVPINITYLRIPYGRSSSSLGTGQSCLDDCMISKQPLVGIAQATAHSYASV